MIATRYGVTLDGIQTERGGLHLLGASFVQTRNYEILLTPSLLPPPPPPPPVTCLFVVNFNHSFSSSLGGIHR